MRISFFRFTKISWKLTLVYSLIFSLVLIFLSAAILYGVKFYLVQQSINQVDTSSGTTEKWIIGTPGEQTDLTDPELLNEAQSDSEIEVHIADASGRLVNSSDNKKNIINFTLHLGETRKLEINGEHLIVKNTCVSTDGKTIAYLQITRNMKKEYTFIDLLFILMAAADFVGILLSIVAGYLISRRILKPIDKITTAAKNISVTDLNSRLDTGGADDELTRLAVTFNDMIDRLRQSFELQNKFVSDASHELRTPISVIKGYINLIDRWGKEDRGVLQESIDAIKNETAGMTELIEKLLFLARGDSGVLKLQKEKVELDDLIREIIRECELIAPEHNLLYELNEKTVVNADRKMVKQLLRALIDNSIKFTPLHGDICISVGTEQDKAKITVSDSGIGIPPDEIDNIFQRFYRVDKSRAQETGGSGIGLAVVKWIVDAHGGSICAASVPGKGTSITVNLPQS